MNDEERLARLFDDHYRAVLAYVLRRSDPDTAQEVAADTFLVAWRRLDRIPQSEARPWLLVVARNSLANHQRARRRRDLAEGRLTDPTVLAPPPTSTEESVTQRLALAHALNELSESDRELLLLIVWDELTPSEAAIVLGCRSAAIRVRLHRARARFQAALRTHELAPRPEVTTP